jgi:hypothetical protein
LQGGPRSHSIVYHQFKFPVIRTMCKYPHITSKNDRYPGCNGLFK